MKSVRSNDPDSTASVSEGSIPSNVEQMTRVQSTSSAAVKKLAASIMQSPETSKAFIASEQSAIVSRQPWRSWL